MPTDTANDHASREQYLSNPPGHSVANGGGPRRFAARKAPDNGAKPGDSQSPENAVRTAQNAAVCTAPALSPDELAVLRHSLGIYKRGRHWTKPYRNHCTVYEGHPMLPTIQGLVSRGLMAVNPLGYCRTSFRVTEAGKDLAAVRGRARRVVQ